MPRPSTDRHAGLDPSLVRYWREEGDPAVRSHADAVLDVLGPFRRWSPVLRASVPDLAERARRAISWLPLHEREDEAGVGSRGLPPPEDRWYSDPYVARARGVRALTVKHLPALRRVFREQYRGGPVLVESLNSLLWRFGTGLRSSRALGGLQYPDGAIMLGLQGYRWGLHGSLNFCVDHDLGVTLQAGPRDPLREQMATAWERLLWQLLNFIIIDDPLADLFRPLLDLWLVGNLPVGIDRRTEELLVLVA